MAYEVARDFTLHARRYKKGADFPASKFKKSLVDKLAAAGKLKQKPKAEASTSTSTSSKGSKGKSKQGS